MNHGLDAAINDIIIERYAQDAKWGEQNHYPAYWLAILGEEVGEANKAFLENDVEGYRSELVQVAAVATAMVESIDRNPDRWHPGHDKNRVT